MVERPFSAGRPFSSEPSPVSVGDAAAGKPRLPHLAFACEVDATVEDHLVRPHLAGHPSFGAVLRSKRGCERVHSVGQKARVVRMSVLACQHRTQSGGAHSKRN